MDSGLATLSWCDVCDATFIHCIEAMAAEDQDTQYILYTVQQVT